MDLGPFSFYRPSARIEGETAPPSFSGVLLDFWKNHLWVDQEQRQQQGDGLSARRANRARLRRCHSVLDALSEPIAYRFIQSVQALPGSDRCDTEALALVPVLLAHARHNRWQHSFPRQLASTANERSRAPFSELRFRRLLRADSRDDLLVHLRRAIQSVDGEANLIWLAEAVCEWQHPYRGPQLRNRWAYEYFSNAPAKHEAEA